MNIPTARMPETLAKVLGLKGKYPLKYYGALTGAQMGAILGGATGGIKGMFFDPEGDASTSAIKGALSGGLFGGVGGLAFGHQMRKAIERSLLASEMAARRIPRTSIAVINPSTSMIPIDRDSVMSHIANNMSAFY